MRSIAVYFPSAALLLPLLVYESRATIRGTNPCTPAPDCDRCLEIGPSCGWCSSERYSGPRCDLIRNLAGDCPDSDLWFPINQMVTSDRGICVKRDDAAPLRKITLQLRPRSPLRVRLEYRRANDPALDLYLLTDGKGSRDALRRNLRRTARTLTEMGRNLTSDARVGLGELKIEDDPSEENPSYTLVNWLPLPLSINGRELHRLVDLVGMRESSDSPVDPKAVSRILCRREVGWRNDSLKVLVFYSEVETPDFHREEVDCPADSSSAEGTSGPRKKRRESLVLVASPERRLSYPNVDSDRGGGPAIFVAENDEGLAGVLRRIVREANFEVRLKDDADENVRVTYRSRCLGDRMRKTDACAGLKAGQCVTFEAEVEVESCPRDPRKWNRTLSVIEAESKAPVALVYLEKICRCPCNKPENQEKFSPRCSEVGSFQCGECRCPPDRFGRNCECLARDDTCFREDGNGLVCSGHGQCVCGVCQCFSRETSGENFYGMYCECDDFSCSRVEGRLCNGPERGRCRCGKCQCLTDWTGEACQCSSSTSDCLAPDGGLCSGNGECVCGSCRCRSGYGGKYCRECPGCGEECDALGKCVECDRGLRERPECADCPLLVVLEREILPKGNLCESVKEDGCRTSFVYRRSDEDAVVVYLRTVEDCPVSYLPPEVAEGISFLRSAVEALLRAVGFL